MGDRLVVIQSDPCIVRGSVVGISAKTLEGLEHYAHRWSGEVVVVAPPSTAEPDALTEMKRRQDLPFQLDITDTPVLSRSRRGAAVTLALHREAHAPLLAADPRKVVWIVENPVSERIRLASASARGVARARIAAGWLRKAPMLRTMIRSSGGMQANGYPAFETYAPVAATSILYFDTRVKRDMVSSEDAFGGAGTSSEDPRGLRVAFSGRHAPEKGPMHAIEAVLAARAAGADITMQVFGGGPLTERMKTLASTAGGDAIRFRGALPFATEWVPEVRSGVDLMVLPHVQGDPAGTYLEAAALGVPTLGFDNRALAALVAHHGLGWVVPMRNDRRLAAKLMELAQHRDEIAIAGRRGGDFMRRHAFEDEFDRRVLHLREVAGA